MKNSLIKYVLIASIFAFSCGKKESFKVVNPFLSMKINNNTWIPDTLQPFGMYSDQYVLKDTTFQVNIIAEKFFRIESNIYINEAFTIYLLKKKLGKQTLYGAPSSKIFYDHRHPTPTTPVYGLFYTLQELGEFVCEDFIVDSAQANDNWVEITHQEGNFKKIWGKFNINLKRTGIENGCTDVKYSNDTKISNGEFYLEL